MPVVNMNEEDYAAYRLYLTLPGPIRSTIRAVVYLCRSDQRLVRDVVRGLWSAGGRQAASPGWQRATGRSQRRSARKLRLVRLSRREPAA